MATDRVDEFLHLMQRSPRRREVPRLAEPLRGVEMQPLAGPQGAIATWRVGEGPAVLLVHGFEDDNSIWTPLLDTLQARHHASVVLDLPAHGMSEGTNGYSPAAADALAVVGAALGPIKAIVGHSLGCWASALAIGEGLAVERFVLIAPPGGSSQERWRRAARDLGYDDDVADQALAKFWRELGPHRGRGLEQVLSNLASEMLFVHSRDDERSPFGQSEELCAGCERAVFFAIDGASHRDTAREPEAIAAIVTFLEA
jgi:pimeloyl-ACP methyl ester carboxylesterase